MSQKSVICSHSFNAEVLETIYDEDKMIGIGFDSQSEFRSAVVLIYSQRLVTSTQLDFLRIIRLKVVGFRKR